MVLPLQQTQPQKTRSHREFGTRRNNKVIWAHSSVPCQKQASFDYVSTTYRNCNILTLYAIPFDLDFDKCDLIYQKDNKICPNKILSRLYEINPEFLNVPIQLTRSRSGQGIGMLLYINPIKYKVGDKFCDSTSKTIWSLELIQRELIDLFVLEGFGADPKACSLRRLVPNYQDKSRNLNILNTELLNKNRRENYHYLNAFRSIIKEHRKKSKLYNDARLGIKLIDLFNEAKTKGTTIINSKVLLDLGISKPQVRRLIGKELTDLPWVKIVKREKGNFHCKLAGNEFDHKLWQRRSEQWLENARNKGKGKKRESKHVSSKNLLKDLPAAESVRDGERNQWVMSAAIYIASRVCFDENADYKCLHILESVSRQIPGYTTSRTCKLENLRSIADWAIKTTRKVETFRERALNGTLTLPKWLEKEIIKLEARSADPKLKISENFGKLDSKLLNEPDLGTIIPLKFAKINKNYAVFAYRNNGYSLELLGFCSGLKQFNRLQSLLKGYGKFQPIDKFKDKIDIDHFDVHMEYVRVLEVLKINKVVVLEQTIHLNLLE